ncbi:kelch repeat-containing protein, partial [Candidatus Riflebacteria bacterium]
TDAGINKLRGVAVDKYQNVYIAGKENKKIYRVFPQFHEYQNSATVAVRGAAAATALGDIYLIGGRTDSATRSTYSSISATSTVQVFTHASSTFAVGFDYPKLPEASVYHAACILNDKVYVAGGLGDKGGEILDALYVYNPVKNRIFNDWAASTTMAFDEGQEDNSMVLANDALYNIGAWNSNNSDGNGHRGRIYRNNSRTGGWSRYWPNPCVTMEGANVGVIDGIIYMVGNDSGSDVTTSWNPFTGKWKKWDACPDKTGFSATEVLNGKLYLLASRSADSRKKILRFDPRLPSGSQWKQIYDALDSLSTAMNLADAQSVCVNGKIYFGGGLTASDGFYEVTISESDSVSFNQLADLPRAMGYNLLYSRGGRIYLIGKEDGDSNAKANEFWEYDIEHDIWRKLSAVSNCSDATTYTSQRKATAWGNKLLWGGSDGTDDGFVKTSYTTLKDEDEGSDRIISLLKVRDGKLYIGEGYGNENHRIHVFDGVNWNDSHDDQYPMIFDKYARKLNSGSYETARKHDNLNNLEILYDGLYFSGGRDKFSILGSSADEGFLEYSKRTDFIPQRRYGSSAVDKQRGYDAMHKWGGKILLGEVEETEKYISIFRYDLAGTRDIVAATNRVFEHNFSLTTGQKFVHSAIFKNRLFFVASEGFAYTGAIDPGGSQADNSQNKGDFGINSQGNFTCLHTFKGFLLGGQYTGGITVTSNWSFIDDFDSARNSGGMLGESILADITAIPSATNQVYGFNAGVNRFGHTYETQSGLRKDADIDGDDMELDFWSADKAGGMVQRLVLSPNGQLGFTINTLDDDSAAIKAFSLNSSFEGDEAAELGSNYTISLNDSSSKGYCDEPLSLAVTPDGTRLIVGVNAKGTASPIGKGIQAKGLLVFDISSLYSGGTPTLVASYSEIYDGSWVTPSYIATPE